MWHGSGIGPIGFCFKALGRQLSVAPIVAAMAFDDGSFARLQDWVGVSTLRDSYPRVP
jgi:hypothetical protein